MKEFIKSRIFTFILGAILFGSVGVVLAYTLFAQDIGFTPIDNTWEVNNVKSALDDLYNLKLTEYGYLSKIWNSSSSSINYTYNVVENGTYLAGIAMCNDSYANPTITTSSNNIIVDKLLSAGNCRSSIKLIKANINDTINISGSNNRRTSSGFLIKLNNVYLKELIYSDIKADNTATNTYTASSDGEKVLIITITNGNSQSSSITNNDLSLESRISVSSVIITYNIFSTNQSISSKAYGYDYGAGSIYIIK